MSYDHARTLKTKLLKLFYSVIFICKNLIYAYTRVTISYELKSMLLAFARPHWFGLKFVIVATDLVKYIRCSPRRASNQSSNGPVECQRRRYSRVVSPVPGHPPLMMMRLLCSATWPPSSAWRNHNNFSAGQMLRAWQAKTPKTRRRRCREIGVEWLWEPPTMAACSGYDSQFIRDSFLTQFGHDNPRRHDTWIIYILYNMY